MNNANRKKLAAMIEDLKATQVKLAEIAEAVEGIADDEREKFENMPEGLQMSDAGEAIERAADALEEARDMIEALDGEIDEAISSIETAIE